MRGNKFILICFLFLLGFFSKAQLVINEVSQGASGNKEYAELVVVGSPTCTTVPCFDLRGYYTDDNNGTFATGAGVGIQNGCIHFTTNALWSCIPAGTIIVIYNEADVNANIPAQDLSMSDGNCRLVIPGNNTTLLERHPSLPSLTVATFPTTGFVSTGGWNTTATLLNGGDSFQTRDASGNLLSAVSWGTDNTFDIIYFAGSQSGKVINNLNTVDINPLNQANWATATVAGNETPGLPNNPANAAWISSMNFSCGSLVPTALTATVSSTNAGCTCNGSATVTASGAIAPYTYSWSPAGGTGTTASGLCAGIFSVTVTSANGCVQTVTVNIAAINPLTATITTTDVSCHGLSNGSATVTSTNAVLPITYTWSPSGGNNAIASNLSTGNYSVTLTDANSCTITTNATINQPTTLSVSVASSNVSCNGGSNGSATITPSGGTPSYTYTWSPGGGNGSTANNLSFGTYSITIADSHQCQKDTQVLIMQPPPLTLTLTSTAETCGQHNGTATASASGGTGTLHYNWNPSGGSTSTASNLQVGNYTVTTTDSLLCSLSDTITVQGFVAPVLSISTTSVLCNGGNSGTATSSVVSGGTPAYSYTWTPAGGNGSSASNLPAATYTLMVTDAKGCKDTAYATINEPTAISATLTSTPATCGNNNGTTSAMVNGGNGTYSYTWSPTGGNNPTANGLASGTYSLTVNDVNACTYSDSVYVANKPSPVLSITSNSITCFGANTGSASVSINTGTGTFPFTYSWTPGNAINPTANNLVAGTYTVLVTDSVNCTATQTVTINQPLAALTATAASTPSTCNLANGTATVSPNGGTPGYSYNWLPAGGNSAMANNLNGNTTYTCVITDANTCTVTTSVAVSQIPTVSLTPTSYTNVTCYNGSDGAVTVSANGGTPAYSYTWQPAGTFFTNGTASNLAAGAYTASVVDSHSCTATTVLTITQPPALLLSVNTPTLCVGQTTTLTVSGASSYTWSTGATSASMTVNPVTTTSYTVIAQDINGCSAVPKTATVTVSPALTISVTPASSSVCAGQPTTLTATSGGGGGGTNTYNWIPSGSTSSSITASPSATTVYTVSVYNAVCAATASATAQVNIYAVPTLSISATPSSGCTSVCVSFLANATGGSVNSYTWNYGDGTIFSSANNGAGHCYSTPGNYDVTLSASTQNNCLVTATQANLVHVFGKPVADFTASSFTTTINEGLIHFTDQSVSNIMQWNWLIDTTKTSVQNPSYTFYTEGTFSVTLAVIDTNGCKDSITKEIIIQPDYAFYAPNCVTPNGDSHNELFLPLGTGWDNTTYHLWIFDRWGNMIMHTTDPNSGWNGTKNNEVVKEDTYVWKVDLYDISGMPHQYNGQVNVIR